jgi:[acyl-carrier-protein] S-malonyltransferase
MTQTAVVIAPGRGTYNKTELGYLQRFHGDKAEMIADFDRYRAEKGQTTLSELDGAATYSLARHARGDNASALIYACAYADFLSLDRARFDIIGVTGNSMGWYIALACAGVLDAMGGLALVNTMGTMMQEHLIGGQVIYPFVDEDWVEIPGRRAELFAKIDGIDDRPGHVLGLSIDLGGYLVLAGNEAGLDAFAREMPPVQERFPLRLANHAGFHSEMQRPVSERAMQELPSAMFGQPRLPLIDGRGGLWYPKASDLAALRAYTLDHQVTRPYDFTAALRTAACELCPDVFIVLGPGTTLGGAAAQALIRAGWLDWRDKAGFQSSQAESAILISIGAGETR